MADAVWLLLTKGEVSTGVDWGVKGNTFASSQKGLEEAAADFLYGVIGFNEA